MTTEAIGQSGNVTIHVVPDRQNLFSVVFSPDGKAMVSGSAEGRLRLWDVGTGREIHTSVQQVSPVQSIFFSVDGKTLVVGDLNKTLKHWDVATGWELRTLQGNRKSVLSVDLSRNTKTVVSGSSDNIFNISESNTGIEPVLQNYGIAEKRGAFSYDGKIFLSGSTDNTIKLRVTATSREVLDARRNDQVAYDDVFATDETEDSPGNDTTMAYWNAMILRAFRVQGSPTQSVAFSPASGSGGKTIKLWDVGSGQDIRPLKQSAWVYRVELPGEGRTRLSRASDQTLWDAVIFKEDLARLEQENKKSKTNNNLTGLEQRMVSKPISGSCKTILPEGATKYEGECNNGLVHANNYTVAQLIDELKIDCRNAWSVCEELRNVKLTERQFECAKFDGMYLEKMSQIDKIIGYRLTSKKGLDFFLTNERINREPRLFECNLEKIREQTRLRNEEIYKNKLESQKVKAFDPRNPF